jgi:hypothetical protein
MSDQALDAIIDHVTPHILAKRPLVVIVPHPPYDDTESDGADLVGARRVTNTLPLAYAARISEMIDGTIDAEIVQKARVGRSKLSKFARFLWQPSFDGAVRHDSAYILVDDVVTSGGTLAALRSHIVSHGGTIAAYTALAHGSGDDQPLALGPETWDSLIKAFGPGLDEFWKGEIGHDAAHLTDAEGRFLARWGSQNHRRRAGVPLLQRLRDRLAEAAAKGE